MSQEQLNKALGASRKKSEELFPDLKIIGSAMLTEANRLLHEHCQADPNFMRRPDCPLRIAHEASFNLAKRCFERTMAPAAAAEPSRKNNESRPAPGDPGSAEAPAYLIAVKANESPKTNSGGWHLDVGQVYKFVRFLSQAEYLGAAPLAPPTSDRSYVLVRMDDVLIAESVTAFKILNDLVAAEACYAALVDQKRRDDEALVRDIAEHSGDYIDDVRNQIRELRDIHAPLFLGGGRQ